MIEENILLHSHRHGKSAPKTRLLLGLSCKQIYDDSVLATGGNLEALHPDQIVPDSSLAARHLLLATVPEFILVK